MVLIVKVYLNVRSYTNYNIASCPGETTISMQLGFPVFYENNNLASLIAGIICE